jgi:hypothetical protein
MHNNTSTLERLGGTNTLSLFYLREHGNEYELSLGASMTFSMMQNILCVLTRRSAKTRSKRRWHGIHTYLPIITSRELVDAHLATYETRLGYLQKITEHNEPFMPALMKASTYITVHYRNGIHALSRCMDSVQPRTSSVWMEYILALHTRHAECSRMKHVARHNYNQTRRWDPWKGSLHQPSQFPWCGTSHV